MVLLRVLLLLGLGVDVRKNLVIVDNDDLLLLLVSVVGVFVVVVGNSYELCFH